MALLQCLPKYAMTKDENLEHLQAELCGLTLATIYLDQFKNYTRGFAIKLPSKPPFISVE